MTTDPQRAAALASLARAGGAILPPRDQTWGRRCVRAPDDATDVHLALALVGFDPVVRIAGWGSVLELRATERSLSAEDCAAFRAGGGRVDPAEVGYVAPGGAPAQKT